MNNSIKQAWVDKAVQVLEERIHHIRNSIQRATEAANSEEKSSAGDKYETARAMSHLERDMHAAQLVKAEQELLALKKLDLAKKDRMFPGAAAKTGEGWYFLSIGLGALETQENKVILLSPASPLGKLFREKTAGDMVRFNQKDLFIEEVL